ncbi:MULTISPECIES: 2-hydroxyacyl-CoA dehydratase [unclassified Breznakia]|uniref:acyl-CoA dehydratase activase-related protein n=1 Tax=unclassified Breznakia TaxID=2623764 RepID=UPI0024062AF1|nr:MULTISPECIES: 2-hydroxyacyl-CoA dehydratase [unclassified Breznakia]MDL2276684.1 2-hydroxyacyl-CoA dehydratase [Breznakia sp. OttesenSCG-928-G09]
MQQDNRVEFTQEMKKTHTILIPNMLNMHFEIIEQLLISEGYKVELLKTTHHNIVNEGVKNVHNDTCYPALLVVGQMIDALKSGKYDLNKVALIMTQTGGGCRASNYIHLLRKALKNNGMEQVPVISVNFYGLETNSGFKFTYRFLIKAVYAIIYGDMLMWISNQCKPYELNAGDTEAVDKKWTKRIADQMHSPSFLRVKRNYKAILEDYEAIPKSNEEKVRVGIVGEIYMKYSPLGNNELEKFLIREGAEPVLSGLLDFIAYCCENMVLDYDLYNINKVNRNLARIALRYLVHSQNKMIKAIKKHGKFKVMSNFNEVKVMAKDYISKGVKMGEGWLLTSEMLELIHSGVNNVICTQPFGCLPNHIVAKGMMRKIKDNYPESNVVAIDYDPGASTINQENRIKLMLSNAKMNMEK